MNDDTQITIKLKNVPRLNERDYAQMKYDEARIHMLENPTKDNIALFEEANKKLFEVQDAYRIGARLILERAASRKLHLL